MAAGSLSGGDGAAPLGNGAMAGTFLERVWAWIHQTFPERQIYIRSDGRVQFFTFGPSLQATLAGLTLIFLGWVAFATVNVIFKDRIIAAKDHRFEQMQSAYENRLADLQISYDELNGALAGAEDKFKATADELQNKQSAITGFLSRKNAIENAVGAGRLPEIATTLGTGQDRAGTAPASDGIGIAAPPAAGAVGPMAADVSDGAEAGATLTVLPGPVAPQPRTAKPVKATAVFDSLWHRMEKFASAILAGRSANTEASAAYSQHPALRSLAQQTARIQQLGATENLLMGETETALQNDVNGLRLVVRHTGINPKALNDKAQAGEGVGGPEIPLSQVRIQGINDPGFTSAYLRASAVLDQLSGLYEEVSHIPLVTPVSGAQFDRSSGFGSRVDPFTGRYAFHPGIDFAGPWGARVEATAPGTVVFAGYRGAYGNMVEVDHGFGIRTRYGHLSAITVKVGARVDKGSALGRVGSTGRSTGPHVHYEVWFDDVVRDPSNFIEAGRHVL